MTITSLVWRLAGLVAAGVLLAGLAPARAAAAPITPNLELEALEEVVRWPNPAPQAVLALAQQFMAARRDREAYTYFRERANAQPDQPLFLALEGMFQARTAGEVSLLRRVDWVKEAIGKLDRAASAGHPMARYFRGLVLAELPARFKKAESAVADLEWVLENREQFPIGFRRNVYRALARAYSTLGRDAEAKAALEHSRYPSLDADMPLFVTDGWVTARDGFRFLPPRLVEPVPGVFVAQGYDFADLAFVVTPEGIVAIDAGTAEASARAALDALRRHSTLPITHVILTHAHWDHIGGLAALKGPNTRVVARANFADELRLVNEAGVRFRYFFGSEGRRRYEVSPDHLVNRRETLTVGGTEFVLYPVRGGETEDALLIHLPARGLLFVGDVLMPYLGAPFLPEGSAEGLFETLTVIRSLEPRLLIHGHTALTENFPISAVPGLEVALREVYERTLAGIGDGKTLVELLHQNLLPEALRFHPTATVPFVVMRDNFIKRVYHQRTGYWKPDGEGLEVFAAGEWAAALDLLGGSREEAFVRTARALLDRSDPALAFKLADLGLVRYPASRTLIAVRRQALDRLREKYQQLNPFKFIIYSELAGADLPPVE